MMPKDAFHILIYNDGFIVKIDPRLIGKRLVERYKITLKEYKGKYKFKEADVELREVVVKVLDLRGIPLNVQKMVLSTNDSTKCLKEWKDHTSKLLEEKV